MLFLLKKDETGGDVGHHDVDALEEVDELHNKSDTNWKCAGYQILHFSPNRKSWHYLSILISVIDRRQFKKTEYFNEKVHKS